LVTELGRRGYAIVEEPGRRLVKEELSSVPGPVVDFES
jgi:predicted ATPase